MSNKEHILYLHSQIYSLKMNNSENATNYMTCIEDAYDKFIVVDTIDHNDLVLLTIKGSIEVCQ